MRPPPEILLLPADATVGQLLDAATVAFRSSYRMCASWTADAVVDGLSVAVPPPALPPAPAAGEAMEVDGGLQAEAAPAAAAGSGELQAMEVDATPAAPAQAAAAVVEDPEARLSAAVAAAAVAAVVQELDGVAASGAGQATQQLGAVHVDEQQAQQEVQLSAEELAQRAQQDEQRAALLAARLADVLLPPPQQAPLAADADAARPAGSGTAAATEAAAQLPSVVVDGRGLDWAIRWRHAGMACGQLTGWRARCDCGCKPVHATMPDGSLWQCLVPRCSPRQPPHPSSAPLCPHLHVPQAAWRTGRCAAAAACMTTTASA